MNRHIMLGIIIVLTSLLIWFLWDCYQYDKTVNYDPGLKTKDGVIK